MSPILVSMLKWVTGDLTQAFTKAYTARQNARTQAEKLATDRYILRLQAQERVLIAEQRHRVTRWIRPVIAAPFAIYIWKIVVWDKVLGWGVTDPLSAPFYEIMLVVLGAYFLARPFEKWRSEK